MERSREPLARTIEIIMPSHLGFHIRVVARFVKCVRQFDSDIRVRKGKVAANGKDIIGLLLLAAAWKSKIYIEVEGDDAEEAIESIKTFFQAEET
ncbi:MAG: HPr family phosphocarrier protein [Candidatus Omnitrophica bacterium]|nr:HPr family phosphocarrier protein [Candidatus Omnitrophota bacterium]